MKRHLYHILILIFALLATACSVLDPPIRPTIPPPLLTPLPIDSDGNPIVQATPTLAILEPGQVVLPGTDPDILALMENVSQQQLTSYVQTLQSFGTRNSFSPVDQEDFGIGAARRWIGGEFQRVGNGRLEVRYEDFPLTFQGKTQGQQNVVATLRGVSQYPGAIVIGAHYDSRIGDDSTDGTSLSPSANDNASGIAMLLELARLMSSRTWNQTIIFVAFASEEQGTAGSRFFVSNAILNGTQVDMALSNDGIGGRSGIPQSVRLFAPDMGVSPSGETARYVEFLNRTYQPSFPIDVINALDRPDRYGDHREFIKAGIGGIRLIESQENEDLLNSTQDTWDKIDYAYLAKTTKINLVTAANWAGAPPPMAPPTLTKIDEQGGYLVSWSTDAQTAGYALSVRPLNQINYPPFRYIPASDGGETIINGLSPTTTYAVSIAPLSVTGRLGGFSQEVLFQP